MPLKIHLKDTTYIISLIWEHWLSLGQREYIANSMNVDIDRAKEIAMFIGGIHDIGKATPVFQTQRGFNNSKDLDYMLLEKIENAGANGISNLLLASSKATHHTIAGGYILKKYALRDDIVSIVCGHHGKCVDSIRIIEEQLAYESNYYQSEDKNSDIFKLWENVQKYFLNFFMTECNIYKIDNLPEISSTGQVLLSGMIIMADWIASNETYFPLIDIETIEIENYEERIISGWNKWHKSTFWEDSKYTFLNDLYMKRFGFMPRDFQKKIYDEIEKMQDVGIIVIEAPMGLGKTEVALISAEQLAKKTKRSGIFFGLPTQATSNSIFPRINEWLGSVSKDMGENIPIRLVHGKSYLNEDFRKIPRSSNINIDGDNLGSVFVNEWFSGRKTSCLDDFVVATIDHFLMMALKQKHLALRHLGMTKKIVIIDEVHAYDSYMSQYLYEALEWLGAYNVPVILLSATLPIENRKNLIYNYEKGKGVKKREIIGELEKLNTLKYPLLTYTSNKNIKIFDDFANEKSKTIKVNNISQEELISNIKDMYEHGGIIGVIVNTVKKAQDLAKECIEFFGKGNVILFHSRFIDADRVIKEQELMNLIGKNANRPEKIIVIGTQVLEQSLDIDFDVLFSELCPIDLLIQRVGRLQRHNINRNNYFVNAQLYVIGTSYDFEFDSGSKSVYGEYILARTQYFLGKTITIPDDIPILVQNVYSDIKLDLNDVNNSKYSIFYEKHIKKLEEKNIEQKLFC